MIEILKKNVDTEIDMLREISHYTNRLEFASNLERKQLLEVIGALRESMKMINNAIPELVNSVPHDNKLPSRTDKVNLQQVTFRRQSDEISVGLQVKDKERFLKELSISENLVRRLRKREVVKDEKFDEFKAARGYLKVSNRFFLETAVKYIKQGYFKPLYGELKKANVDILFEAYVAMMFFTTLLSIFAGIFITIILLFFNFGIDWPFVSIYSGSFLGRLTAIFWIPLAVPVLTFLALYVYPMTEKSSIAKKIDSELPFAVIHMSAISGSGIAPSEIFRIIGLSREYPFLRREIRKVLNQINLYGYDLVTAIGNVAKSTPSTKLAELFNGISTTINSGGDLSEFFEKRAETLLANYQLEREKFTRVAETFMDIYISVVIAAPMILMLLLVMISLTGIETGFSTNGLAILIILFIALINIFFLGFLQIKQPTY